MEKNLCVRGLVQLKPMLFKANYLHLKDKDCFKKQTIMVT